MIKISTLGIERKSLVGTGPMVSTKLKVSSVNLYNRLVRNSAQLHNGHLRGPMTLTPVAKRLAVDLSLPVLTT